MMKKQCSLLSALLVGGAAVLLAVSLSGLVLIRHYENQDEPWRSQLNEIDGIVDAYFVGEYDEQELTDAVLSGYMAGLGDPYSYYLNAEEYEEYQQSLANTLVGVGITVSYADGQVKVVNVIDDSPAQQAGILPGDQIIAVDGASLEEIGYEEMVDRVKGEEGTQVSLTFVHPDGQQETQSMTRKTLHTVSLESQMLDNQIGYIRIIDFHEGVNDLFQAALEELTEQGAQGVIFDLRNNPGGSLDELVPMLDSLLPEGDIISMRSKDGETQVYTSDADCLDLPMAVLVNSSSYSAAEFFAAALQEYSRATIVGEQTTGKGYSQSPFELSNGGAIVLSRNSYFTPQGKSLAQVGITPDIPCSLSEEAQSHYYFMTPEEDTQLQAAIDALAS